MLRPKADWHRRLTDRLDLTPAEAQAIIDQTQFIADLSRVPVEDYFISNVRLQHGGQQVAAAVASFSQAGLFNPTTSDDPTIGIVEWHFVGSPSVISVVFREHTTIMAGTLAGRFSDRQWGNATSGRITQHSDNTNAAQQGVDGRFVVRFGTAGQPLLYVPLVYVLPPATGFSWVPSAINTQVDVAFQWREFDLRIR